MLKVFVPQYDQPTKDNARLANDVFPNSPRHLVIGNAASREALHLLIADVNTTALLVMAHGDSDCVLAQNGAIALTTTDIKNDVGGVLRLPIFAWVCRTSQKLGQVFHLHAKPSGAWWGYRTTVSAPDPRKIYAYREVLKYIVEEFHQVRTEANAKAFFLGLRMICDRHYWQEVRRMADSDEYGNAHESAVGLREAWQHLDAMLPQIPQPYQADRVVESTINEI